MLKGTLYQAGMMDWLTAWELLEQTWGVRLAVGLMWIRAEDGAPVPTISVIVPEQLHVDELAGFDHLSVRAFDPSEVLLETQYHAALIAFEECLIAHLGDLP